MLGKVRTAGSFVAQCVLAGLFILFVVALVMGAIGAPSPFNDGINGECGHSLSAPADDC